MSLNQIDSSAYIYIIINNFIRKIVSKVIILTKFRKVLSISWRGYLQGFLISKIHFLFQIISKDVLSFKKKKITKYYFETVIWLFPKSNN